MRGRERERELLTHRKAERINVCYINIIIHIFTYKVTIASLIVIERIIRILARII